MKHSKHTTNNSTKLKTGLGSSAPFLCGMRKTSIVASFYYLLFPALYLASRPLLPEGRAGIAWGHQSSKFSVPPTNRYSAPRHTLLLPPLPLPSPPSCLYSPSSSLSSTFIYTTKGKGLSSVRCLLSRLQII